VGVLWWFNKGNTDCLPFMKRARSLHLRRIVVHVFQTPQSHMQRLVCQQRRHTRSQRVQRLPRQRPPLVAATEGSRTGSIAETLQAGLMRLPQPEGCTWLRQREQRACTASASQW
jgi:hypothetical protein